MLLFLALVACCSAAYTECRYNITKTEHIWNCSHTFELELPRKDEIPAKADVYDLSYNRILELHVINSTCKNVHSCEGCLRKLYLHHNDIDTIENNAFVYLFCLKTLDLSYNKIHDKSLSSLTFDGLLQLDVLSLKGNPLGKLVDFTLRFNELRILKKLDLSDCQLSSIATHAFDDLQLMEQINLSGNQLQTIDPESFRGLSFLGMLDLSRNAFSYLTNQTFRALIRLQTLSLHNNTIESVPDDAFVGLETLEDLSLANNWFQGIPYNAMKGLQSLKVLDISGNHIRHLEPSNWPEDIKLRVEELYINDMKHLNSIDSDAFFSFPLLKKISISGNPQLELISHEAFLDKARNMEEVYLNNNNLHFLPQDLLHWTDLKVLELDHNPWNCECKLKWIQDDNSFKDKVIR